MHFGKFASRKSEARYPSLWDGLVGAWCPSIQSPSGVNLYDLSGRNRHGVLTNMDPAGDWVRNGLDFDGSNDYVLLPSISAARWTYAARVFVRAYALGFSRFWAQSAFQIDIGVSNSGVLSCFDGTAWRSFGSVSTGQWTHVAIAYTGAGLIGYINGAPVSSAGGRAMAGVSYIGASQSFLAQDFLNGQIDDVCVYNRPLAGHEVRTLASRRGVLFGLRRSISFGSAFRFRRGYSQIFTSGVIG